MIQMLQAHSSTFYLLSSVLFCSILFGVFLKVSEVFIALRKLTATPLEPSSGTSVIVTASSFLPASMVNRVILVAAVMILFGFGTGVWNIVDRYRTGVVDHSNVHVLTRYDDHQFCMETKGNEWSFRACEPFPKDIVAGVTLRKLKFVYDTHMNCDDWTGRTELGYTAWRTPDDKPVISQFARSSSTGASCASPRTTASTTETTTEATAR